MIGRQYKAHRDNVIDLFERYNEKRGAVNDGIDLDFLKKRVEDLKNNKFSLAVAGEVKAGKSTFINALLGAEILPADVLQATSAVVEIFKSHKSYLRVFYANGEIEEIYDDLSTPDIDEAKERLQEICKIPDEYRDIPTTLVDNYIIEYDKKLKITDELITSLEKGSGVNLQDKKDLIEKYIKNKTKDTIPVKIEFGYPLKWDFDQLRIVDTPGVNATGGVQDISFKYLEEANAILFVHPIKPIESESFRKFVNSVISNRSKETLFLILSHAGLYSVEEIERLYSEAKRLYKDLIPEEKILIVDSLLQLILNDLKKGKSVKEIRKQENKKKILAPYREIAEDENRELIEVIQEAARFEKMFSTINEFAMQAPFLQLQEILEKIKEGYREQENQYQDKIDRLEKKKRNPQEFEEEINRINKELDCLMHRMKKIVDTLKTNYSGRHSEWNKEIEALKVKYPELITGSENIEMARKHFVDAVNEIQGKINMFSKELTEKLKKTLEEIGKEFKKEHKITIPKVDLEALEEEAKKNAFRKVDVYKDKSLDVWDVIASSGIALPFFVIGAPMWGIAAGIGGIIASSFKKKKVKIGTRKVYDSQRHLEEFKNKCNEKFFDIVNELSQKSKEVLDNYLKLFTSEMNSVINERQKALEKERENKQTNDKIIREIDELKRKKNSIQPEIMRIEEVLEDLK